MNPSPIPPGTLSTTTIAGTLLAAALGAFQGHPGWLCLALALCVIAALGRAAIEVWKGKGPPAVPPAAAALLLLALLSGCATPGMMNGKPGHFVTSPPDITACGLATLQAYQAQQVCDVSPPPPATKIIECAIASILAARPCVPAVTWVPDETPAPAGK